jgi:hypothetical protein
MADEYSVEFYGLTKDEWPHILEAVEKHVGIFGHRVTENGKFKLGGKPNKGEPPRDPSKSR